MLPILYKKTKTGTIQQYKVWIKESTIYVEQGQVDGKKQIYTTLITTGKNIGKANETTPAQQAQMEALAKHEKKIKAGYTTDSSGELTVKLPMKVKAYYGNEKNIIFPCKAMPKLNGVNGEYRLENGKLNLYSRGGDLYPTIPHLEQELRDIMSLLDTTSLNGELYIHGEHLQDITSAVKKPKELSKKLTFHVFALPTSEKTFEEVCDLFNKTEIQFKNVHLVKSSPINSHQEIEDLHTKTVAANYEGLVVYNHSGKYQYNTRSSNVFKVKKALDAEYQIADYETDKNGHPVFHCLTTEGKLFKVKPKGTNSERKKMIVDFENTYLNKWYKIEYETLSKDNIPLKPVGIALRNCDPNGNPLE